MREMKPMTVAGRLRQPRQLVGHLAHVGLLAAADCRRESIKCLSSTISKQISTLIEARLQKAPFAFGKIAVLWFKNQSKLVCISFGPSGNFTDAFTKHEHVEHLFSNPPKTRIHIRHYRSCWHNLQGWRQFSSMACRQGAPPRSTKNHGAFQKVGT